MNGTPAQSFHLFTLWGHRVHASLGYGILIAVLSFGRDLSFGLAFAAAATISILWHEFGHAFAFKRFGCGPSQIMLHGFGGLTSNHFANQLSRKQEIWTFAAGPIAGLILSLPFWGWLFLREILFPNLGSTRFDLFVMIMAWINLVWSLANLLPIYPLDGGQIFRIVVRRWTARPLQATAKLSLAILALCAFYFIQSRDAFMIVLLLFLGIENFQLLKHPR